MLKNTTINIYTFNFIFITSVFLLFSSCSSMQSLSLSHIKNKNKNKNKFIANNKRHKTINYKKRYHFKKKYNNNILKFDLKYSKSKYNFWIKYYANLNNKQRLRRQIKRGLFYKEIVQKIFKKHHLPIELYYVGLIESGYYVNAKSNAKAVGPWQFMKGTAKQFHLKISWYIDERKNIIKSTHAAANYFKDLYNIFGSWELAVAAYNTGENRMIRAIRKGNTRSFIKLSSKKLIPRETSYYLSKIMATKNIAQKIERKLKLPIYYKDFSKYKAQYLRGVKSLKSLSRITKVPLKFLQVLNPEYIGKRLPARKKISFIIPIKKQINRMSFFHTSIKKIVRKRISRKKYKIAKYFKYKVQRGDSLFLLSHLFNLSIKKIKKINHISRDFLYFKEKIRLPIEKLYVYKVKKGDTLLKIAGKFKVKLGFIKHVNQIVGEKILLGQKIEIPEV